MGGNLKFVSCGGSKLEVQTSLLFTALFGANIKQGYGSTETTGCGIISDCNFFINSLYLVSNLFNPNISIVPKHMELKLVPCPSST